MAFSKFKDKSKKNKPVFRNQGGNSTSPGFEGPIRVKLPRDKEVLGVIEQRVGAQRMLVKCLDGKSRNCRVPGRLKRRLWLRERDIVIVKPWEFDDSKGDVLFKYNPSQIEWLRKKRYLQAIEDEF